MEVEETDAVNANVAKIDPIGFGNHKTHLSSFAEYSKLHKESVAEPEVFWTKMAQQLSWFRPFSQGDIAWFLDGELNVAYNCLDRHARVAPERVALIWEPDEVGEAVSYTYQELLQEVCRFSLVLKKWGVRKGDIVALYMPMVPEAVVAMLACARVGAIHNVIFAGFSADALRERINDASAKLLITADQGKRGGKVIQLKQIADEALAKCPTIQKVIVFQRTGDLSVPFHEPRDVWWHEEVNNQRPYCPCEPMNSEDPLFMLYTSGSTEKPKGVLHTTAGYLLGAHLTTKYIFDIHPGDVHGCMADIGWITGHSYIVYGPLCNGTTTVLFEGIPTYPHPARYWDLVDKLKITSFYTAPTALRTLRKLGDQHIEPYSLKSLRVLGSVGEPINPEVWTWYYEKVGRSRCAVVDTYWQTETGSIILSPLPGVTPLKPGSATFPFFGVDLVVLDHHTGKVIEGNDVSGVLAVRKPFPSINRSVFNNHVRYLETYMKPFHGFFFTGDAVTRDKDGFYWIRGRVDDVINISGHRISTAEIESVLVMHPSCAEAAVVGVNDEMTGQAMVCFCIPKQQRYDETLMLNALRKQVREHIGPFATPKRIIITPDLPKTRSGKIMRRILRKCAGGEITVKDLADHETVVSKLGDISTLAEPSVVQTLVHKCAQY